MLKVIVSLLLATLFIDQCGPNRRPTDQAMNANVQPRDQTADCGFSKLGAMKPRATYSSPVVSMPRPIYPDDAKARGIKGAVTVILLVDVRSGQVENACVTGGNEALAVAAKEAGLKVKFAPYAEYIQKKYSHAQEIVTYNFQPE